jgi:hypothetical protein
MIDRDVRVTTLQEFFSEDTVTVELKFSVGVDAYTHRLAGDDSLELLVVKVLLLDHASILEDSALLLKPALATPLLIRVIRILH